MSKVVGSSLHQIPWQDKPAGYDMPIWRYSQNPIINRNDIKSSNSIFNSAVVQFKEGYAGVFRCDSKAISMDIYPGFSEDGVHWRINEKPIVFQGDSRLTEHSSEEVLKREYRYDPRVCFIEDRYYITWCNGYHGPTIGLGYTFDFKTFYQMENVFLPYNRNGVLFPRKIDGKYAILSRPSDNVHTSFGDIYYSESKDLEYWGHHRHVMSPYKEDESAWQSTKVGPGPVPIETDEGWLLIYHGVHTTCNGFTYRMGCALLDIDEPWKVKYRSRYYVMAPYEIYECVGDVPNVVFPCATVTDADTGRIAIYYGCADTVTGLAFTTAEDLIQYMKENPM